MSRLPDLPPTDPEYHYDKIMEGLRLAASHLPRVDAIGGTAILGVAMGSNEAAGYLNPRGAITGELHELAFVPVDFNPAARADEWSGDRGVGALYFSQQAVNTIGTYLAYTVAHYADYYAFERLLILGRVTSGRGGEVLFARARQTLADAFPELAARVALHVPDEKSRRMGQAVAAASLPALPPV